MLPDLIALPMTSADSSHLPPLTSSASPVTYLTEYPGHKSIPAHPPYPTLIESALDRQLRGAGLPSPDLLQAVVDLARTRSCQLLLAEDYDLAALHDHAVDVMISSLHADHSVQNERAASLQRRLEAASARGLAIAADWDSQISDFRAEANRAISAIGDRHIAEQRALQAEWALPAALLPFSKPSAALLALRRAKRAVAMTRDYHAARALREECERKAREEAAAAGQRAADAMRADVAMLRERQQREIDCFVQHARAHIARLTTQRDVEMRANENLRHKLKVRLKTAGPAVVTPKIGWSSRIAPETMRRLNSYRREADNARLEVRVDGIEAVVRAAMAEQPRATT
jgi:hypothetical protein